jgi:hypothetical protein
MPMTWNQETDARVSIILWFDFEAPGELVRTRLNNSISISKPQPHGVVLIRFLLFHIEVSENRLTPWPAPNCHH